VNRWTRPTWADLYPTSSSVGLERERGESTH